MGNGVWGVEGGGRGCVHVLCVDSFQNSIAGEV